MKRFSLNWSTETSPISHVYEIQSHSLLTFQMMNHENFMKTILCAIRKWLQFDEFNVYVIAGLEFMVKFVWSSDSRAQPDPVLADTLRYFLDHSSTDPRIQGRIIKFINSIVSEMPEHTRLDDGLAVDLVKLMLERLKDFTAEMRVQAVHALRRFQLRDKSAGQIMKEYLFHMACDPSAAVRIAVLSAIERNEQTLPEIIERCRDIDESVRRHMWLQMCGIPVKSLSVQQRLALLEQGKEEEAGLVRDVINSQLLPIWLRAYDDNLIELVASLKCAASDSEFWRFIAIAKNVLLSIFGQRKEAELIAALPLMFSHPFEKCIPLELLTIEGSVYWLTLIEYLQRGADEASRGDEAICDLSVFCDYIAA